MANFVRLEALDRIPYGNDIFKAGDQFDATEEDAFLLLEAGATHPVVKRVEKKPETIAKEVVQTKNFETQAQTSDPAPEVKIEPNTKGMTAEDNKALTELNVRRGRYNRRDMTPEKE